MKIKLVEKLRVKAIAQRALRNGNSDESIVDMLMEDYYFDEIRKNLGEEETIQILQNVLETAKKKETTQKA